MKNSTITFLLIALLAGSQLHASVLTVRSATGENIVARIDGSAFTHPAHTLEFPDLAPGRHTLVVSKLVHAGNGRPNHRPIRREIFRGSVFVPVGSVMTTEVSFRQLSILAVEEELIPACPAPVLPMAMSSEAFHALLYSIESKSFESSRLTVARQAVAANCLSTAQVAALLQRFTFESTKLEFAKFAYLHTVDQQNYFLVNDAFTFESSIGELQEYIDGLPGA